MKLIRGSHLFPAGAAAPAIAIGNFDGVHLGHRSLLERTLEEAARRNGLSVLFTFDPHPVRVLSPEQCPKLITTHEQKLSLIEALGIDMAVVEPFTQAYSKMTPQEFFERIIVQRLYAKSVIIGYDFTFGIHRSGTIETFEMLGKADGVDVIVVPAVFAGETLISSTIIRNMIVAGDMIHARELLGRPYSISGKVVPGRGVGRTLAARTANIESENELMPGDGVYLTVTTAILNGAERNFPSITSIGDNPTFPDPHHTIETHIIDAEVDVRGKTVSVQFMKYMRGQIKFGSVADLREQIASDITAARQFHSKHQ